MLSLHKHCTTFAIEHLTIAPYELNVSNELLKLVVRTLFQVVSHCIQIHGSLDKVWVGGQAELFPGDGDEEVSTHRICFNFGQTVEEAIVVFFS